MALTIVTDGSVKGTKVFDKETKVEVKNVRRIVINIEAGKELVEAIIEVICPIIICDNISDIKKITVPLSGK